MRQPRLLKGEGLGLRWAAYLIITPNGSRIAGMGEELAFGCLAFACEPLRLEEKANSR